MRLCGIRYNWTDHSWQYVWHMHLACWINTNKHADYYLLLFYSNHGYTKMPQCCIICTLRLVTYLYCGTGIWPFTLISSTGKQSIIQKRKKSTTQDNDLFSWLAPVSAYVSHLCQWLRVWVQENSCDTMMYCSTRHPLCPLHKLFLIIILQYSYFICNISYLFQTIYNGLENYFVSVPEGSIIGLCLVYNINPSPSLWMQQSVELDRVSNRDHKEFIIRTNST
jgi:hypothetical protein